VVLVRALRWAASDAVTVRRVAQIGSAANAARNARTAVILVTDLVDSTKRQAAMGEEAAAANRRHHDNVLSRAAAEWGGTVTKSTGDGVVAHFASAVGAASTAVTMQQRVDGEFDMRIGISAGDVTFEDGDVFGMPVIEATRLCDAATGGQILASDLVRMMARGRGGLRFEPAQALDLKGIPEPVLTSELQWERIVRQRSPLPAALRATGRLPFSGRTTDIRDAMLTWNDAVASGSRMLLIGGEPGVGKTRLTAELATSAHASGALVVFGRADPDVNSPYRPLAEALGPLLATLSDHALADHVDGCAGALTVLVPELQRRVPGAVAPETSPEETRSSLFDAVADVLRRAGRVQPVMLVLDDLHNADRASLLLVRHLALSPDLGRVLVVCTYRDTDLLRGHPLRSMLADLWRIDRVRGQTLAGLNESEVLDLMTSMAGHALDARGAELARVIRTITGGNPFFLGEVLIHLAESGALYETDGRWDIDVASISSIQVPRGVRDVVRSRLDQLPDDALELLRVGAVLGEEFPLRTLAAVAQLDEPKVIDALEDALGRRLLTESSDQSDRLQFSHALVRHAIYDDLVVSRRIRLHARAGKALEDPSLGTAEERAHHLVTAAAVTDVDDIADAVIAASEAARRMQAWEAAAEWAERGLAIAERSSEGLRARSRIQIGLATALIDGAQFQAARDALVEAADAARQQGDGHLLALVASRYAAAGMIWLDHDDSLGLELVDEAEAWLDGDESPDRAALLVARAQLQPMSADPEVVAEPARQGLEMTRRTAPEHLANALWVYCDSMRGTPRAESMLVAAMEARGLDGQVARHSCIYFEIIGRINQGRFADVEALAEESFELGRRTRTRLLTWYGHTTMAGLHTLFGRWDDATQELAQANELAELIGDTGIGVGLYIQQFMACRRRHFDGVRDANDEMIRRVPRFSLSPRDAVIGALDRSMEVAELQRIAADWSQILPLLPYWVKRGSLAWMSPVMRHAPASVAAEADRLLASGDHMWISSGVHESQGHAAWFRGALAEACGDLDAAIAFYDRAEEAHRLTGEVPIRANNLVWSVEARLHRGSPGDRDAAHRLAEESAELGERHHIIGLADLVASVVA
jgi:class 3 adenylate cyclase